MAVDKRVPNEVGEAIAAVTAAEFPKILWILTKGVEPARPVAIKSGCAFPKDRVGLDPPRGERSGFDDPHAAVQENGKYGGRRQAAGFLVWAGSLLRTSDRKEMNSCVFCHSRCGRSGVSSLVAATSPAGLRQRLSPDGSCRGFFLCAACERVTVRRNVRGVT